MVEFKISFLVLFGAKEKQLPKLSLTWYNEVCSRYDIPLSEICNMDEDDEDDEEDVDN